MDISLVIPLLNENDSLIELTERTVEQLKNIGSYLRDNFY